ncbi:xylulokinase [Spirochaeta cellobiosiphila]|uniref:xylulokinase n=1 Tax=Spirochaeta cellobiosiphila TaxID=504483 RepID=UPI000402BC86|nr:FGGY-family carbohydrate kinase [Spirochaeta cellobiosiphila]
MSPKLDRKLVLCIDVGTSALKGGLIDSRGDLFSKNTISYKDWGTPDYDNWNPQIWIDALRDAVASLGGYDSIAAVSISSHGPSLVPIDKDGRPTYNAMLWLDQRNSFREGGTSYFLPKAAWLRDNHPEVYDKTSSFLSVAEYISYYLTGEKTTITSHDEFTPYIWKEEDISLYDLDPRKFPPFVKMGDIIGTVQKEPGFTTGLPQGVPVVASGSDFLASLLGTGAVSPGRVCDRAGSSEGINLCAGEKHDHPHLRQLPHVIEGYQNLSGILSSTGRLFEWYRRLSGLENSSYRQMLMGIEKTEAATGKPLFIPTLNCKGAMDFHEGVFWGLEPEQDKHHLGRAVVEAIGYSIKSVLHDFESIGYKVEELRVSGGQAKNVMWNQIKSDIIGKRILVPEIEDAELLGNACCAMVAQGEYPNLKEASEALVKVKAVYTPRWNYHDRYKEGYEHYLQVSKQLKQDFARSKK